MLEESWYIKSTDAHTIIGDLEADSALKICYESTTMFFFTNFQYIACCLAFSIGKPFKKNFTSNVPFTTALALIISISVYTMFAPEGFIRNFFSVSR